MSVLKDQLREVKNADLSHFDKETNSYFIPKRTDIKLEENKFYLIELDRVLLHPTGITLDIMNKWNHGDYPKCSHYKVDVNKILGLMVQINGVEFDYESNIDKDGIWSGWLPIKCIKILDRI